ncbi:hypothetical protein ISN45_Aa01g037720 [Arabidopsis thaliana x Arabidopsis arenosa]|uniref:TOD1/MUCI70 glycosyltransferase-like domain-containing protein n=1 Tax=Arabidopsis thaliana x Arabidopsis arenosa TaxID=1240361 RepID=A0A8T2CBC8_9BRAS|nr:hypothetical protein ISN45_Aa01g037720 [Arabidopsis thaliana x Arabidopsis arenosa]KAG7595053.1 hypothetical protein ISN45_Aa01g037720 [Arabidopsis thaliana x Arabidopsis arenosa]
MLTSNSKEKERSLSFLCCWYLGRRRVAMLLLLTLAFVVFVLGSYTINKESNSPNIHQSIETMDFGSNQTPISRELTSFYTKNSDNNHIRDSFMWNGIGGSDVDVNHPSPSHHHPCDSFSFPPPPPPGMRRPGPRPCPVCYLPPEEALAHMPKYPFESPVLKNLTYIHEESPVKPEESQGGSDFGGYPSLEHRTNSFDIKESMTVHCGFIKGTKPGHQTGFDIDEDILHELDQSHDVIVASAIFGKYDIIQEPVNISEMARKNIPFYMFVDEETHLYLKNTSSYTDDNKRVGLWRIIVVHNVPYTDARRNGKVPKLLLHRLFPNVRYSIWVDAKLQLVVDPYQILERFLWRTNSSFAISRHYRRFDVFVEAEANKAARKYDNASIDYQVEFYKKEGLTPYTEAKLPITSDVPEGCTIIREHIPITNLFTCVWFNEVDRFTSRDQLSFAIARDKIREKVDWSINMFLDCERRNFVKQVYHRDVLMNMKPPRASSRVLPEPPALPRGRLVGGRATTGKKTPGQRGKRRHRKVSAGGRNMR